VTTTLPEIPYFDPELRGPRFRSTMREIAAESWLADSPLAKFVLDREAAEFFLRHRATTFPGQKVAEIYGISDGALKEEIDRNILHLNGADHARLRGKVNHAFTPKAADGWRPVMRDFIAELFARVEDDGRCEAVEALCKPYPAMTIATIMGAPLEDAGPLAEWSNWIQRQFAFDFQDHRDRIEQACQELYDYLDRLPRRGLLETLGELEDRELVNLAVNVLVGGIDTTQSQLAQALRLFAEHPEQWEVLRADPSLAADAVQAILHHEPITPFTARICLEDIEFRGVTFPRDSLVFVWAVRARRSTSPRRRPSDRSPSEPASTTAWARTSRAPSSRRRSPISLPACPGSAWRASPSMRACRASTGSRAWPSRGARGGRTARGRDRLERGRPATGYGVTDGGREGTSRGGVRAGPLRLRGWAARRRGPLVRGARPPVRPPGPAPRGTPPADRGHGPQAVARRGGNAVDGGLRPHR
jgi:hypothetical protein